MLDKIDLGIWILNFWNKSMMKETLVQRFCGNRPSSEATSREASRIKCHNTIYQRFSKSETVCLPSDKAWKKHDLFLLPFTKPPLKQFGVSLGRHASYFENLS